ncbi:uncharacterized protein LOC123522141 [Echinops telfairi]|uniref:Uncharacterized protein LOC123522141 n=1 Tax=Echinops telfairi TaxID=9371 RepID=A0AC55DE19_ECHTE|nr:uncharacterized protein LOC123522141 [Echinops telfairi]
MAFNGVPTEDGGQVQMTGERPARPPPAFTVEPWQPLKQPLLEDPYPDFTRRELSDPTQSSLTGASSWFQNRRSPFPAEEERRRLYWVTKQERDSVQGHTLQDLKPDASNSVPQKKRRLTPLLETLLRSEGCSAPNSQGVPGHQGSSDHLRVSYTKEPDWAVEYQGDTGRGLFPGSLFPSNAPDNGFPSPASSRDRGGSETGGSQCANSYFLHAVHSVQGVRQQPWEGQKGPYSGFQGEEHNDWQQFFSVPMQEQGWYPPTKRKSLCSLLQQATLGSEGVSPPPLLGQDVPGGGSEQPGVSPPPLLGQDVPGGGSEQPEAYTYHVAGS